MSNRVIWLTGLSGAGKTTIANKIKERQPEALLVDGDELRSLTDNRSFHKDGRMANVKMAISICQSNSDRLIVVSLITPFWTMRDAVKQELGGRLFEVYVQCSLQKCIERDTKGLYAKALSGEIENFTGISQPYEEPVNADAVVNTEFFSVNECVDRILR